MTAWTEYQKSRQLTDYIHTRYEGDKKMATLREEAQAYEPKQTKNVGDLPRVDLSWTLEDREGKDQEGITFKYKVFVVDGIDYRIPGKVIGDIKEILKARPEQKYVKVVRKGVGKSTTYTVLQVD